MIRMRLSEAYLNLITPLEPCSHTPLLPSNYRKDRVTTVVVATITKIGSIRLVGHMPTPIMHAIGKIRHNEPPKEDGLMMKTHKMAIDNRRTKSELSKIISDGSEKSWRSEPYIR